MSESGGKSSRSSRDDWASRIADLDSPSRATRPRKEPITVDRILESAFRLVEAEGFEALTMRRIAVDLATGPASLYAHVQNKAELDDLLIGELSRRIELPVPDPARWKNQIIAVCHRLREEFTRYPGVSRAALAAIPTSLDTLRVNEGMLAILLAGGVEPRRAAWAIDALFLYVCAFTLEASLRRGDGGGEDARESGGAHFADRLRMLPVSRFPHTVAHAGEVTSGSGHDRFDFTLDLLLGGLTHHGPASP